MTEILAVVVGWVLGIVSAPLVEIWNRREERRHLAAALATELNQVNARIATTAHTVWSARGELTPGRLEWLAAILERANSVVDTYATMSKALKAMATLAEEKLAALNAAKMAETEAGRTMLLRVVEAPFLTAHLHRIVLFSTPQQQALLQIEAHIRLFNDVVRDSREFYNLTFSPEIGQADRKIIIANLRAAETGAAERAEHIAELIANMPQL